MKDSTANQIIDDLAHKVIEDVMDNVFRTVDTAEKAEQ